MATCELPSVSAPQRSSRSLEFEVQSLRVGYLPVWEPLCYQWFIFNHMQAAVSCRGMLANGRRVHGYLVGVHWVRDKWGLNGCARDITWLGRRHIDGLPCTHYGHQLATSSLTSSTNPFGSSNAVKCHTVGCPVASLARDHHERVCRNSGRSSSFGAPPVHNAKSRFNRRRR